MVDGALMEFLRAEVSEPTANTFTQVEISTPASRSEELAMLIWKVVFQIDMPDVEDGQRNAVQGRLTRSSQTAIINEHDPDLIAWITANLGAGQVEGSLSEYFEKTVRPSNGFWDFAPPVLYAKSEMFAQVVGTGNAQTKSCHVLLGYTLERVSTSQFISALVE